MKDKKSLIIYFSRADENYFGGDMKYVKRRIIYSIKRIRLFW